MKNLVIIIVLITAHRASSQSIAIGQDTITLHCAQATSNGETTAIENDFLVRGSSEVEWSQDHGNERATYTITGITGSWANLNTEGRLELNVTIGSITGRIVLARPANGPITIRIQTFRGTVDLVPVEFIVSSFQKLN